MAEIVEFKELRVLTISVQTHFNLCRMNISSAFSHSYH